MVTSILTTPPAVCHELRVINISLTLFTLAPSTVGRSSINGFVKRREKRTVGGEEHSLRVLIAIE